MNALEPPIVQYWHEEEPPPFVAELLTSVAEHNPARKHLVFSAVSAEDLIGTHYGERAVSAFRACALPAMQADYFRYCAIHALGGVYIDADCRCLADVGTLVDGRTAGVLFGRESVVQGMADLLGWPYPVGRYRTVVNGFFGFSGAGHPLLELAIELATANIEGRLGEGPVGVWLAAGPGIFTSLYLLHELGSVDDFATYAAKSALAPSVPLLCRIGADPKQISRAFRGIEIRPIEKAGEHIAETWPPQQHRAEHWAAAARQIYK